MLATFTSLAATSIATMAMMLAAGQATAAEYEVVNRPDIVFAAHDGVKLLGDLYLPKGLAKAPVLVAVHGGGWQIGSRQFYRYWGLFFARAGYAVFAIDYRLAKDGTYPRAVYDTKAAVQFIRAKATEFSLDPDRIGLIGDSAGAQLGALVALAGDQFNSAYQDDANAAVPAEVKALVGFYGVYDMYAQWTRDLAGRPEDKIVEKFLGVSATRNRRIYFEASPISYATVDHNKLRVLLIHGTHDDVVDSDSQSGAFLTALTQAQFFARRIIIPGAGHFWSSEPFEADPHSYAAQAIPRLMRFLESSL
jgi:acetyl esterase/lipase